MKADKAPEAPVKAEPVKEPEAPKAPVKQEAPAEAPKAPAKAAPAKPEKAPAKTEKAPAKAAPQPPADRKALDALVKKEGIDTAIEALSKVKVVDLRALAREYNGEFGIAGREIRNANKKVLIEEFRKFFTK